MNKSAKYLALAIVLTDLTGCAGTVIDTTTDVALALAKTPFKVAGAVVDVVSDDD